MGLYTCVHFINLGLNRFFITNNIRNPENEVVLSNYMYSIKPNNPLSEFFQSILPGDYWHMYLAVPILLVYLLIIYAPELIRKLKKTKKAA